MRSGVIRPSRGVLGIAAGIHVEVPPFGTTRPGRFGPKADLGSFYEGAYVEFDAPPGLVTTRIGPRNSGLIPTPPDRPLDLSGLNPRFVFVRRWWWEFWRTRPE
jgi:hypothetical protein